MIVRNAHSARVASPYRRHTHTQRSVAARFTHLAWNTSCHTSSACSQAGVVAGVVGRRLDDALVERDDGRHLGAHQVREDGDGDGERDAERGGAQERAAAERQGSHPRRLGPRVRERSSNGQPTVVTTVPAGACQTRSSTSSPTRTQPLDTAPMPRRVVVWIAVTAVPVGLS